MRLTDTDSSVDKYTLEARIYTSINTKGNQVRRHGKKNEKKRNLR